MYQILLVDDEPIVKVALRTIVDWESNGFSICATASNGKEALVQVEKFQPDIIITDLKMPKMDGLELIKHLKEKNYTGKILVASNFGEYELVREALTLGAMDYMLKISIKPDALVSLMKKAVSQLEDERQTQEQQKQQIQQMEHNIKKVRSVILKEYLTNPEIDEESLLKNGSVNFIPPNLSYLCYLSLQTSAPFSSDNKRVYPSTIIENILREILDVLDDLEIIPIESSSLLLIIPKEQLQRKGIQLMDLMHKMVDTLKLYTSALPTIIYSLEFIGYAKEKVQFEKCRETLNILFYDYKDILSAEQITFQHFLPEQDYRSFSVKLEENLKFGNTEEANATIDSLLEQCHTHLVHPEIVKIFFQKVLNYLPFCVPELDGESAAKYDAYKESISYCDCIAQLKSTCCEALQLLQSRGEHVPHMKKEVLTVITFINQNYAKKITLTEIARQVNLNENYLCRIFKEQTGKSIINYINQVRMENAAKIILNGNVYMKEVAAAIGIEDPFYFTRLFKKYFGINPTEYKTANFKRHQ